MTTSRLETFADGVFAIAATLLILDVSADGPDLGHDLLHIWPSYTAYAFSFLTIGIMWVNHHAVFDQVDRVDRPFLFLNIALLMGVAFVPFPTRLIAEHLQEEGASAATFAYGATMIWNALCFSGIWFYASVGGRLLRQDADPKIVSGISRSYLPGPYLYLAAMLVGLLSPEVSAALYAAIALFYVVESSLFAGAG